MLETISIKGLSTEEKTLLLSELGFGTDGVYVTDVDGVRVIDDYIDAPVLLENMMILPGSVKVLDNNPLSIASYLEEHPDAF